jgi:hypothetical protein
MQDNNRIDDQFIDHAWANMNAMLDQEMPVQEKKKRRFALLWFLLPLLLLGGIVGDWQFGSSSSNIPVSHFRIPLLPNSSEEAPKEEIPIAKADGNTPDDSPVRTINKQSLGILKNNEERSNKSAKIQRVVLEVSEPLNETKGEIEIIKPQETLVVLDDPKTETETDFQKIALLHELETLNPSLLELQNNIDLPQVTISSTSSFKPLIGLELGARTGNGLAFGGAYAGVFTDFNLGNRFGISTGLSMDWQRVSFEDRQSTLFSEADEAAFQEVDTTDLEVTANAMDPVYYVEGIDLNFTANVFQLELPLKLTYSLDPKWTLMGGGYVNYVLTAFEQEELMVARQEIATGNASPLNLFRQDAIDKKILNRWNYGLEAGVLYKITPKWHLNLDVSYGLKNWLREGDDTYRTSAQLGVRYQIN